MENNVLYQFIVELINRLKSSSPKFFKVIQLVAALAAALTGLPALLTSLGIHLPTTLCALQNKVVAIASVVALIMARLPINNPTPAQTPLSAKKP